MLAGAKPMTNSKRPKKDDLFTNQPLILHPSEIGSVTRRQLLEFGTSIVAHVGLSSLLGGSKIGLAQTSPTKKLVWIHMNGGWDILETTDPKQNSTSKIDVPYDWGSVPTLAGSNDVKVGRWLTELAKRGQDVTVIRGLAMGTTPHDAGTTYMDTGILSNNGTVNAASVSAIVASESAATIPIIQLSGGLTPKVDRGLPRGVSVVRAENLELYRSMYPANDLEKQRKDAIMKYLSESMTKVRDTQGDSDKLRAIAASQIKIQEQLNLNVASKLTLTEEDKKPFSSRSNAALRNTDSFALALKLLQNDLVTCINIGVGGFDTHSNQERSLGPNLIGFDLALAIFIDELKKIQKLSQTIIVVTSDFGRSPKINRDNGRDDWPVGGGLCIGGGVAGGRAIGATDNEGLLAQEIDMQTGQVSASGQQLNSTHLGGTVIEHMLGSAYLTRRSYLNALPFLKPS
jgi:hypothetical protein